VAYAQGESEGVIYFDPVNGVSGTAYPIGRDFCPVNNIYDLRKIAAAQGIKKVIWPDGRKQDIAELSGF